MAERGKARYQYISDGSNTTVASGEGTLYSLLVQGSNGGSVLVSDTNGGLGATPDYNSDSTTGLIARIGPLEIHPSETNFEPHLFAFHGLGFNDGLTVAASSNFRVLIEYE